MRSILIPCRAASNQREGFRRSLEGLLLLTERQKRLPGLVSTDPGVGAQLPRAQKLPWFLSESDWDERQVQAQRFSLLCEDPFTAPTGGGVLAFRTLLANDIVNRLQDQAAA